MEQRHVGTEATEDVRELDPDVAGAENRDSLR
jgi:hypothetical protein